MYDVANCRAVEVRVSHITPPHGEVCSKEDEMNKKLVFVIQVNVDDDQEASFRKSLGHWIKDARAGYSSDVQIDEVKIQED